MRTLISVVAALAFSLVSSARAGNNNAAQRDMIAMSLMVQDDIDVKMLNDVSQKLSAQLAHVQDNIQKVQQLLTLDQQTVMQTDVSLAQTQASLTQAQASGNQTMIAAQKAALLVIQDTEAKEKQVVKSDQDRLANDQSLAQTLTQELADNNAALALAQVDVDFDNGKDSGGTQRTISTAGLGHKTAVLRGTEIHWNPSQH